MSKKFISILLCSLLYIALGFIVWKTYLHSNPEPKAVKVALEKDGRWTLWEFSTVINGRAVAKFKAKVDDKGYRYIPTQSGREYSVDKHLVVFGGSFAFGYGLSDSESLTFLLHQDHKAYQPFSFASMGGGVNRTLDDFHENKIPIGELKDSEGIAIFVLTRMHLERATGKGDHWKNGASDGYYERQSNGRLKKTMTMSERYPDIYDEAANQVSINVPYFEHIEQDYEYVCSLLHELKSRWQTRLRKSKFVVVYFPHQPELRNFNDCFNSNNIEYWDFVNLGVYEKSYLEDGHPNSQLINSLAEKISEKISETIK